jgi:hypothetical protein
LVDYHLIIDIQQQQNGLQEDNSGVVFLHQIISHFADEFILMSDKKEAINIHYGGKVEEDVVHFD